MILTGGNMTVADMVELARRAEGAGAASVFSVEAWRSGFVPLAAIATATERVRLGTYVINAYGRSPFIAGMEARDLDDLSGGRLVLGVGSGNVFTNRVYQNLETARPLRKLAEYVELLRLILAATPGQSVEFEGEIHAMSHWMPQADSARPSVPVYLAALFPKMRRVAGRVADGIALGSLQGRDFLASTVLPAVHEAVEASGRDPADFGAMVAQFTSIDEDREAAYEVSRYAVVDLFHPKPHRQYEHTLREQGYGAVLDQILALQADGNRDAAAAIVPDELIEELTITGTPDECVKRLADYDGLVEENILMASGGSRHRLVRAADDEKAAAMARFGTVIDLIARVSASRSDGGAS
ncbi:MAG: LLM class flavin-dependent oxidoreductase [Acidimicrobiia bacterium]